MISLMNLAVDMINKGLSCVEVMIISVREGILLGGGGKKLP